MTEDDSQDGAAVRFPPPLVAVIMLVVGIVAEWFLGPLATPLAGIARGVLGLLLAAAGLGCMLAAIGLFRKSGQDPTPWKSSPELISSGIYQRTRNPMYLGMGFLQAGIGVLLANLWVVALVPVTWALIYVIAIRHEEAYLTEIFGEDYRAYKSKVRRWL